MNARKDTIQRGGRKPRAGRIPRPPPSGGGAPVGRRAIAVALFVLLVLSTPVLTALRWPPTAELLLNGGLLLLLVGAVVRANTFFRQHLFTASAGAAAVVAGAALCFVRIAGSGFVPVLLSCEVLFKIAGIVLVGFALGRRGRRLGDDDTPEDHAVLRSTLDSIAEPIVVVDRGCRVCEVNWYAELTFTEPLQGLLACETEYYQRETCVGCPVGQCFEIGRARFFTVRDDVGKPRFEVSAMPVEGVDGSPVRQVQHLCDVRARSQTEERLRFLGDVVASLSDAVFGLSVSGKVTALNPRCEGMLGVSEEEAIGRPVAELLRCGDERSRQRLERAVQEAVPATLDLSLVGSGNRVVNAVVSIGPVMDDDRRRIGMSVIVRDVTESRRVEEMLRQSEKMSSLGAFVSGLVHELNNPLHAIHSSAELLRAEGDHGGNGRHEHVDLIYRHADNCRRIVEGLLRFARKSGAERQVVDLNRVIADTSDLLGRSLVRDAITLRLRPGEYLRPVWADPSQLQQVLVNLLSNARDSIVGTGSGGIIIVTTMSRDGQSVIQVEDDGAGIDPSIASGMFEAFVTTKAAGCGTGLGLSISNAIVLDHGGTLAAETRASRGAVFRVSLPVHDGAPEPDEPAVVAPPRRLRLLVVDDEPVIVEYLRNSLELLGHEVVAERSSREALGRLTGEGEFDLVLCDVCMPGLNGDEFYRAAVDAVPVYRGRFVFVTGDLLAEGLPTGEGNRVLFKPFSRRQLEALVGEGAARTD